MKNWKRVPTYEECLEMCEVHGEMVFYMKEVFIQNYKIHIFSYRYPTTENFIHPLENNDVSAHDLRGLTFVFNEDGTIYKRYVGLPKFWNINQTEESQLADFLDLKIKSVYDKRDGTLISFIKLPNGNIIPKTIKSIYGEYNVYEFFPQVKEIYDNSKNLRKMISFLLDNDFTPIFEYTSYNNKIVLRYDKNELNLLRVRNNITGEFDDAEEYANSFGVGLAKREYFNNLKEIVELAETKEDKEGWVIEFEDGTLLKQKTAWYFERHDLLTGDVDRENKIAQMILKNTIDDAISLLDSEKDKQRIEYINHIQNKIVSFMDNEIKETMKIYNECYVKECGFNIKSFANKYKTDERFAFVIGFINGKELTDMLVSYMLKKTYRLKQMKYFLDYGHFN